MSMYADYLKEHRGDEIVENDTGFATYRYLNEGKTVYIIDIYVRPDFRRHHAASALADEIVRVAKSQGAVELLGTVVPSLKSSTDSLKTLLGYGMTLGSSSNDLLVFRKDI